MAVALTAATLALVPSGTSGPVGDVFSSSGNRYGGPHPSRPTGKGAVTDDSVYCQQTPDGRVVPKPYHGTGRNIPCGLNRYPPAQAALGDQLCNLRDLARLVFQRYQSAGYPIATYRLTNFPPDRYTYLVVVQGIDSFLEFDATKSNIPPRALQEASGKSSAYTKDIVEVIKRLDWGPSGRPPRVLLAGHSHGGMAVQSAAFDASQGDLRNPGAEVFEVVTFGAPMTRLRNSRTYYVQVFAERDTVVDALGWLFNLNMGNSAIRLPGVIRIPGGPDLDQRSPNSSHNIYPRSVPLSLYDMVGNERGAGGQEVCWTVEKSSLKQYTAPALASSIQTKGPPSGDCTRLPLRGEPALSDEWKDLNDTQRDRQLQAEKLRIHGTWLSAREDASRQNDISELIGMTGMERAAERRGYQQKWVQPLKNPAVPGDPAFGIDGYYEDAATNSLVLGEAKGGMAKPARGQRWVDFIESGVLGQGYKCLQGTLGWAKGSLQAIIASNKKSTAEKKWARFALDWINTGKPVRMEVYYTTHAEGYPGVTRTFLTDAYP